MAKVSKKFETVKKYYNTIKADGTRMWSITAVRNAVAKGWITEDEFEEITGEKY
jgi:hypothetical protein